MIIHICIYKAEQTIEDALLSRSFSKYLMKKHNAVYNLNHTYENNKIMKILNNEPLIGLLGEKDAFEYFYKVTFLQLNVILHDIYGGCFCKMIELTGIAIL